MHEEESFFERGEMICDRYEVIRLLGEGGFGVVYEAKQLSTNQTVAIKVLIPERIPNSREARLASARFEREMLLLGQLNHPNAVRLIDFGELDRGRRFMVLEFIEGEDLRTVLREEGSLPPEETRQLMMQVLDVLCIAHDLGIVHRDLKPANIMVTASGAQRNVKVLDFGISGVTEGARGKDYKELTAVGRIPGTPSYMAPEQLEDHPLTPQSDLYSWGLVLLECLTGRVVIDAPSLAGIVFKQVSPEPIPIPDALASHPLGEVIARSVSKQLDQRFSDSREAFRWLKACDCRDIHLPWQSPGEERRGPQQRIEDDYPAVPSSVVLARFTAEINAPSHGAASMSHKKRRLRQGLLFVGSATFVMVLGLTLALVLRDKPDARAETSPAAAVIEPADPPAPDPTPEVEARETQDTPEPVAPAALPTIPMVSIPSASVELGLDAKGLSAAQQRSKQLVSKDEVGTIEIDILNSTGVLPAQTWARPDLEVMAYEVTWAVWEAHLSAASALESACPGPLPQKNSPNNWPVTRVGAREAEIFCDALGMRLPTAREWEAIARGPDDRRFAFSGGVLDQSRREALQSSPVFAREASWNQVDGVANLSAGVEEWVACDVDLAYCKNYGRRGGASATDPMWWQTFIIGRPLDVSPECARSSTLGFRCIKDAKKEG